MAASCRPTLLDTPGVFGLNASAPPLLYLRRQLFFAPHIQRRGDPSSDTLPALVCPESDTEALIAAAFLTRAAASEGVRDGELLVGACNRLMELSLRECRSPDVAALEDRHTAAAR